MIQTVNKYPIDEIFKSDGNIHYFIPKYQREYTWGYNDWDNMFLIYWKMMRAILLVPLSVSIQEIQIIQNWRL